MLFVLCFSSFVNAAPAWKIDQNKSSISFSAIQNDSPITGQFKTFAGEINFDPSELNTSYIKMTVSTGSVSTSYKEVEDTLKTVDWFNIKIFPNAVFTANKFVKTGDKSFEAMGKLTLRDKTLPVVLSFILEDYTKTNARVKGTAQLKRTAFGVGQGEWNKTDNVHDDVQVNFTIVATRK
jgi:polyisoprenoid-binding protein YceI